MSTLFAYILKLVSNVRQLFAADDFSRRHLSDAFFLRALRVNFACWVIAYAFLLSASRFQNDLF